MFAANSFLCRGQHKEALELYTEVLTAHNPEHPHALLNRSLAYIVLSYPELGAADAFRAAVLVTRVGEPGWPQHEDVQDYLNMVYVAKKSHLPWAYGVKSCLGGRGMNVSPCSVSLEICPDSNDNVNCHDFWYEVECKAKYRLALALWRCGGGAVRDALDIIEDYLNVCPTNRSWGDSFYQLGNLIIGDLSELIHAEDGLKERLIKDGILRRSTDDEDKFDMRGIRGLMKTRLTMVKREIYPWNRVGRERNRNADHLMKMVAACAPNCRVTVVSEVDSSTAKMPTFVLRAKKDIFSGEEVLEEISLLQAAATTTESNSSFSCDACAAPIDYAPLSTNSTNSAGEGLPNETGRDDEGPPSTRPPPPPLSPARTYEGQNYEASSERAPPLPADINPYGIRDSAPPRSPPAPVRITRGVGIQVSSRGALVPSAKEDKQSKEGATPKITYPLRTDGIEECDDVTFIRPLGKPLNLSREPNNDGHPNKPLRPVTSDGKQHIEDPNVSICSIPAYTREDELYDAPMAADAGESSPKRSPTPELRELSPSSKSILCGHCRRAYFCSQECIHFAMAEYHLYQGCWGVEDYVRRDIADGTSNHHTIPDVIPTTHARIYELLLARILALAIQRGEHPLEIEEVRYLPGDFFVASRFVTSFDSGDSDDDLAGEEQGPDEDTEPRETLPWSYDANIKRPFGLMEKMGLSIFQELEWFDAWVINTLMAKIMTSTRFSKGKTDDIVVGSIYPVLSLASKATTGWNCEIDGDEQGLYRTVVASRCANLKAKDSSPAELREMPCISAGEEILLRTASVQNGVDAVRGKTSSFETWIRQLGSKMTQHSGGDGCDMESSGTLERVVSGLNTVGVKD
jgi:hypothetical protein